MPDIEFLPESVDDDDSEEELGSPRRAGILRWLGAAALAAVVVAAVVVAATRGADRPAPFVRFPPVSTPTTSAVADPNGPLKPVFLGPYSGRPALDVAVLGSSTWVLQTDGVHVVGPTSRRDRPHLGPGLRDARLVPDPAAGLVWLVSSDRAWAFDAATVDLRSRTALPPVTAAAALRGRLYVLSYNRVLEVDPARGSARVVLTAGAELGSVAADPSRQRLIIADLASPADVMAVTPRDAGPARVDAETTIRSIKPTLAVARGAIWLAGFDPGDGNLMRLDPVTLRPALHSSLDPLLEPGAVLAAGGTASIWVRDGGGGPELQCLDAASGQQLQTWLLDGHVASAAGHAVIGAPVGALILSLRSCQG